MHISHSINLLEILVCTVKWVSSCLQVKALSLIFFFSSSNLYKSCKIMFKNIVMLAEKKMGL